MTPSLTTRLREVCEFDVAPLERAWHMTVDTPGSNYGKKDWAAWGAKHELKKLKPVLERLIECVDALKNYTDDPDIGIHTLEKALAALSEVVK